MARRIKNFFNDTSGGLCKEGMCLNYHAHIDALHNIPSAALSEFINIGFEPYNFDIADNQDATVSDLTVNIGEGRNDISYLFVLNFQSNKKSSALEKAERAAQVMRSSNIKGYTEVERVYEIDLPNKLFNQTVFNSCCIASGQDVARLPFYAEKGPLRLKEAGDFAAGEIHLTLPRTINGQIATNPVLLKALFETGLYGPDIQKTLQSPTGTFDLIDIPLTLSAARMPELTKISKAFLYVLDKTGWSADTELTQHYPVTFKYEIMEHHAWFGSILPEETYRDVLWKTHFRDNQPGKDILDYVNKANDFIGYKLFSPNCTI